MIRQPRPIPRNSLGRTNSLTDASSDVLSNIVDNHFSPQMPHRVEQ